MKILFAPAHYYFSDKYGSEPYWAYQIVKKSAEFGHEVTAIVGVNDSNQNLSGKIKLIVAFPQGRSQNVLIEAWKRLYFIFFVYFKTQILIRKDEFDIIHHILPCSLDTFSFLSLLKTKNIPFIIGPLQIVSTVGGKQSFVRTYGVNTLKLSAWLTYGIYQFLHPLISFLSLHTFSRADAVIFTSRTSKKYYNSVLYAIKKTAIIPVGIAVPVLKTRSKSKKPTVFLSVGYLTDRKGHMYLLKSFNIFHRQFPETKLYIVGNGPEYESLRSYINKEKLSKAVKLVGFIDPRNMAKYYLHADVFVLPSISDSFPTVLLEAMGYGLPVITSQTGSTKEMVGKAGTLTKPASTSSLLNALKKIYLSKETYRNMQVEAKKQVKNYNWDDIIRQYNDLYIAARKEK